MTGLKAFIRGPDGYDRAITAYTYRGAEPVPRCFPLNSTADLAPGTALVFKNTHMTGRSAVSIIPGSADGYDRAITAYTYRGAEIVSCCLPINSTTNLAPVAALVFKNTYMTGSDTVCVIPETPDGYDRAVGAYTCGVAEPVPRCFPLNSTADLTPDATLVFKNTHMTGRKAVSIIIGPSDGYDRAVGA